MHCPRCGASVTVPSDLYVETTRCAYCGTVTPLPDELAQARALERRMRENKARADAEAHARAQASSSFTNAKNQATSSVGWIIAITLLGILGAGAAIGFAALKKTESAQASAVRIVSEAERQANLAALEKKLAPLRAGGCNRVVVNPATQNIAANLSLKMHAEGNCTKLVMASAAPGAALEVTWTPPAGRPFGRSATGALELEHCPTVTGSFKLALTGPTSGYAYAVVDCPPAREKFADDPEKNGNAAVSRRLKTLTAAGCSRVLMAPEKHSGSNILTATIRPGPLCTVVVGATGVAGAKLGLHASSPIGETIDTVAPAQEIESVICPKTAGPHKIEVTPTTKHYWTVAGVLCPKSVAGKLKK
jgi:hypothetical protein